MSADVFPNAKNVTPAMFCDRPSVFEIMNKAGHRLQIVEDNDNECQQLAFQC